MIQYIKYFENTGLMEVSAKSIPARRLPAAESVLNNRNSIAPDEEQGAQKKKKRFTWFNLAKDGKGVKKEDIITKYTLVNFFKLYGRRFGTIVLYALNICRYALSKYLFACG